MASTAPPRTRATRRSDPNWMTRSYASGAHDGGRLRRGDDGPAVSDGTRALIEVLRRASHGARACRRRLGRGSAGRSRNSGCSRAEGRQGRPGRDGGRTGCPSHRSATGGGDVPTRVATRASSTSGPRPCQEIQDHREHGLPDCAWRDLDKGHSCQTAGPCARSVPGIGSGVQGQAPRPAGVRGAPVRPSRVIY